MRMRVLALVALPGMLALALVATAAGKQRGGLNRVAPLSGKAEVPAGDPDGGGIAQIRLKPATNQVCFTIRVKRILPATGAHIHKAPKGQNGPVVVNLAPPTTGKSTGCSESDIATIREIQRHPRRYYVNVHNAQYPDGAVRGQLRGQR